MHSNVMPNARIYASDGKELGTVKEVRGDYFKVDAPMKPDYWLPCDIVTGQTGDSLTTAFASNQISGYKHEEPPRAAAGAPPGGAGFQR